MDVDEAPGLEGLGQGADDVVLEARDMRVAYPGRGQAVHALRGVSLTVRRGEIVAVVGESGCGKSTLALAVQDLIPPPARVTGEVLLAGATPLLRLSPRARRRAHGEKVGMVFQASQSSMNPVLTIATQAVHVARGHGLDARLGLERMRSLLGRVGLDPGQTLAAYPHQLSGGQRQRASLCLALVMNPPFVVLDEPTTGLDPLVQHEVHDVLRGAAAQGRTVFLSSHALGEVEQVADRVGMIRAGRLEAVERIADLRERAAHIVEFRTVAPFDRTVVERLPGVVVRELTARSARLEVTGSLDPIVRALADRSLEDLTVREPDLEELFLTYYTGTPEVPPAEAAPAEAPTAEAPTAEQPRPDQPRPEQPTPDGSAPPVVTDAR